MFQANFLTGSYLKYQSTFSNAPIASFSSHIAGSAKYSNLPALTENYLKHNFTSNLKKASLGIAVDLS